MFYPFICGVIIFSPVEQNAQPLQQATEDSTSAYLEPAKSFKSPKGAMLRSLVPGWGQFYNGQIIKGLLVLGGQGTLLFNSIRLNQKVGEATPNSAEQNFYIDNRNLMYWLMGALTLLSMLDAYIDAHLHDFDTGPDLSLRIGQVRINGNLSATGGIWGLTLRAGF